MSSTVEQSKQDAALPLETLVNARTAAVMGVRKAAAEGDAASEAECRAYIARMDRALVARREGK